MRRLVSVFTGWAAGLLLFLACAAAAAAAADIADINAAINKAGRQRMLSQRIAKAYFQIGQNVDAERSRRILETSVALFDRQLAELKAYAPAPEIRDTYRKLDKSWAAYKAALLAPPSKAGGQTVLALSEDVLRLAHQATVQLEKHSGTAAAWQVSVAGRQRMLSQRMAKYYQALNWGIGGNEASAELGRARQEFLTAHEELKKVAADDRPLKSSLELVGRQWIFFEAALGQRGDNYLAGDVAAASELILQEMEVAVDLFERRVN